MIFSFDLFSIFSLTSICIDPFNKIWSSFYEIIMNFFLFGEEIQVILIINIFMRKYNRCSCQCRSEKNCLLFNVLWINDFTKCFHQIFTISYALTSKKWTISPQDGKVTLQLCFNICKVGNIDSINHSLIKFILIYDSFNKLFQTFANFIRKNIWINFL